MLITIAFKLVILVITTNITCHQLSVRMCKVIGHVVILAIPTSPLLLNKLCCVLLSKMIHNSVNCRPAVVVNLKCLVWLPIDAIYLYHDDNCMQRGFSVMYLTCDLNCALNLAF